MATNISWPLGRAYESPSLELRGGRFEWGRCTYLMGIINVTPDSFSGDGTAGDVRRAVDLALQHAAEGAHILDIGGESSRPGAEPLDPQVECSRLLPALEAIRPLTELPISVDTYHADVADAALAAGADAINDISGLRADPRMASTLARHGAALFAMHNQRGRAFHDVIGDIRAGFQVTLEAADAATLPRERVVLDPGFGFGWTPAQNIEMLRRLPELWDLRLPLLVGVSRKSTIGLVLADAPANQRVEGTAGAVALAVAAGADIVRVHDTGHMRRVVALADAIARGWP